MAKHRGTAGKTLIGRSLRTMFFGSNRQFDAATKGMRGERLLGKELQKLPEGWRVWHDLDIGGENIDHLVASAKGVFIVEVKNYRGELKAFLRGIETPFPFQQRRYFYLEQRYSYCEKITLTMFLFRQLAKSVFALLKFVYADNCNQTRTNCHSFSYT